MLLEKALELITGLLEEDDSFHPVGETEFALQPPGAQKLDKDGSEVFSYIWQEPNGDWSVVSQVRLAPLHKDLLLSRGFEKALTKFRKSMFKRNLSVGLEAKSLGGVSAKSSQLTDVSTVVLQQLMIKQALNEFIDETSRKLKLPQAFQGPDGA